MLIWLIGQLAVPHAVAKPTNWWAIVLRDSSFARCESCVLHLRKRIFKAFNSQKKIISKVVYSRRKSSLYVWTEPGEVLDTVRLKEILKEEGVKDYEILH